MCGHVSVCACLGLLEPVSLCACGCVCVSQRICAQPGRREGIPDLGSVSERGPDPEGPPSKTHQAPGQEHDAKGLVVAKSLQSCPTLCDPIDGSPPGSPVPGILQARTLEWVAISFSNA